MRLRIPFVLYGCLVLTLSSAAVLPAQGQTTGKKFALLVGVNEYQHPKFRTLKYAENDVTELAELLQQGGYTVVLLCDATGQKDGAKAPTRANIEKAFQGLLKRCVKGDTMLVALAGHGLQFEGKKDAFFCPVDAVPSRDKTATLVSLDKLYQELDDSFAGVKILLVDACRDDPNSTKGLNGDASPRPPEGVLAFFSCRAGERAFEHDKYKHGIFFHYLLKGLKGQAKNSKDQITFSSLTEYVQDEVSNDVPSLIGEGARQSPNVKADWSGPSPVLLAQKRKFALLVGVNQYQHPNLQTLKYAESDVNELAQVLNQSGYEVILLCDREGKKDRAKTPTRANVDIHLKKLLQQCSKADTILVAFSGLGMQFQDDTTPYFLPVDGKPFREHKATLVSMVGVIDQMAKSSAGYKVLFVDACREGHHVRGPGGKNSRQWPRDMAMLFSCSPGQRAYELDALKHGVFFHFVLEGLRGKAKNVKGQVTFSSLADYVLIEVTAYVPRVIGEGARQSPNVIADFAGPSPVLLAAPFASGNK